MKRSTLRVILKEKIGAGMEHVTRVLPRMDATDPTKQAVDKDGNKLTRDTQVIRLRSTVNGKLLVEKDLGDADRNMIRREQVKMVEEYCKANGVNPAALDASDPLKAQVEELKSQIAQLTTQLSSVVTARANVAAPKAEDPFDSVSDEELDEMIASNDITVGSRVQRAGKIKALKSAGVGPTTDDPDDD